MSGEQDCVNHPGCEEHGVHVKEHVTYRLTVHIVNGGPGTATNVRAVIRTPKEPEVDRITPGVCDESRYCEIGTLASGQDATITLRGEYADPARAHNWVFVQSDSLDSDHENNEAGQRGVVEEPVEEPVEDEGFTCFGKKPTIRGTEDPEVRSGTADDDVIATFGGDDTIDSLRGTGVDRLCSGSGDDLIFSLDFEDNDFVDCGPGVDVAIVDAGDVVRSNCETRDVRDN